MSQNRWLRPDPSDATPSQENRPSNHATEFFSSDDLKQVTQVAETLAAHGGGALSTELALDLVLHSLVEQARDESGASGAAIALIRDGEMVCRATTGENAPDLGVRVETGSSLAGACLQTGQIQQCRDTETDSRVNAEACRRLGVRSMVIAPLADEGQIFGILQAFSAWPNAFGEREISALRMLTQRIAESKRAAASQGAHVRPVEPELACVPKAFSATAEATHKEAVAVERTASTPEPIHLPVDERQRPRNNEVWSSFLVILVIAAAVLLGVVVGWHGAAKVHTAGSAPSSISAAPAADTSNNAVPPQPSASSPSLSSTEPLVTAPVLDTKPPNSTNAIPRSGGLVISENGKVIYRTPSQPGVVQSRPSATRLIHRVEPEYPPEAKAQNLQGAVVLVVQINGDGTVGDIGVTSGDPILAKAAVDAVKQWKYQPNVVNGHAVESQAQITVNFKLPPS